MGLIFLWAFFDKLFGLRFATSPDKSWLAGGSPTYGFLTMAAKGPLSPISNAIAGNLFVDWLFMMGLFLIGVALVFGVMVNVASYSGALLMFLMWSAVLPPENNPVLDDHIIYALVLILFSKLGAGDYLGFGRKWNKFIGKNKWLK